MEKKEEKTGLAFIDRVCEVNQELQILRQQAPAENKAALIIISTQHLGGRNMKNLITLSGEPDNIVHAIKTALSEKDLKKLFLAAMLAEVIVESDDNNEEEADE